MLDPRQLRIANSRIAEVRVIRRRIRRGIRGDTSSPTARRVASSCVPSLAACGAADSRPARRGLTSVVIGIQLSAIDRPTIMAWRMPGEKVWAV